MGKKARMFFTAISVLSMIVSLFVLSSCQGEKQTSVDVSVQKEQPVVQTDNNPAAQESPAGQSAATIGNASKISPSDMGGPLLFNYIVDENDASIIKTVKFQIRNFGSEKIVPYIAIVISNDDNDHQQQFTYEELQPRYKLQKEEQVDIQIIHPRTPIVVTANLFDKNTKKLISKVDYTYLAYPLDS